MAQNSGHFFGRGPVQFTPPLLLNGSVDVSAPGAGANWGDVSVPAGKLRMPPGRFIGNAKGLSIKPVTTAANVPDYTELGEGADSQIIQSVTAQLVLFRADTKNLADYLHASVATASGGTSTTIHAVGGAAIEAGSFLPTDELVDLTANVTVVNSWATAWTENVHWQRDAAGVRLLQGFSGPTGGLVTIGYTVEGGATTHEALRRTHVDVGLLYTGVNKHDNRAVRADAYRCRINVGETLDLISENTLEMPLSMKLQPVRLPGDTMNRWFRLKWSGTANG